MRRHKALLIEIRAIGKTIKTTQKQIKRLTEREEAAVRLYGDPEHVLAIIRIDHPEHDEAKTQPCGMNTYKLPLRFDETDGMKRK